MATSTDMCMPAPVKFPIKRNKHWMLTSQDNGRARTNRAIGLDLQTEVEDMKRMNEHGPYQQPQAPGRPSHTFRAESVATTEAEAEIEEDVAMGAYDTKSRSLSESPRCRRNSLDATLYKNISHLWSFVMVFCCYFAALPLAAKKAYSNNTLEHKLRGRNCMISSDFSKSFKMSGKERRVMDSWIHLD
ncbi:hypothetical protein GUITHDRAFT_150252 [Guillardia theta CCMP2712]|uniref:Uncharacterized protein n=2 Tax=Guillardia theta TaxID=55529 RepID=L1JZP2_GUITC|nr:hypothetical protein GUITHDRAFT_150252 [Guillardia theta CCMP2712]EKX53675.1 hypothetical protein GUITHDRAFT_150252 [Guillardia theta CCMP2712]|eukprot:XP_005840655.1 hypothetical protein GUITHDRAFT_150252 [Guillardia theta CCMP2712]